MPEFSVEMEQRRQQDAEREAHCHQLTSHLTTEDIDQLKRRIWIEDKQQIGRRIVGPVIDNARDDAVRATVHPA